MHIRNSTSSTIFSTQHESYMQRESEAVRGQNRKKEKQKKREREKEYQECNQAAIFPFATGHYNTDP